LRVRIRVGRWGSCLARAGTVGLVLRSIRWVSVFDGTMGARCRWRFLRYGGAIDCCGGCGERHLSDGTDAWRSWRFLWYGGAIDRCGGCGGTYLRGVRVRDVSFGSPDGAAVLRVLFLRSALRSFSRLVLRSSFFLVKPTQGKVHAVRLSLIR